MKIIVLLIVLVSNLASLAGVTCTYSPVGSATDFPSSPAHTGIGTLGADSSNASGTKNLTIPGGTAQGIPAGTAIGEIFKWPNDKSILSSIEFISTGSSSNSSYKLFLFDLGTNNFFATANYFAPKYHKNMLNADDVVTMTNIDTNSFVELDFVDHDKIPLQRGHSYAFGLLSVGKTSDLVVERSGGAPSDPYGLGFTADDLDAETDNTSPFSPDGIRNVFIGVYATPAAKPAISMAITNSFRVVALARPEQLREALLPEPYSNPRFMGRNR